ncbi:MAG: respiratory nitrate reductase subunit gamma [Chloroflexi bacterium 44-23]|nr:MAG: respiratory nitrate reductase subunit gamma [Chloroflexi bacterium 44-23]
MIWDTIFFIILPYIAFSLAIAVGIYRSIYRPFTVTSLSSQLLERKKLYWGSISFHYGLVTILLAHLYALTLPKSVLWWNSVPIRLYLLELTGLALGIFAFVGICILLWRRFSEKRVQAVTTPMDIVVLVLVFISILTGILIASLYRFGSSWFTVIFTPYILSMFAFKPNVGLVAPLPWLIKLHVINFFIMVAVFPFSRLIHIFTYPFQYLYRPWQIVIWNRKVKSAKKLSSAQGK